MSALGAKERKLGQALAEQLRHAKAILGVFDEGCMGMYNAIIPDELLNPLGVYKERLSQSSLYYETTQVRDEEAQAARHWLDERGMQLQDRPQRRRGPYGSADSSAVQDVHRRHFASPTILAAQAIGIQYQQGLKDLLPASDLARRASEQLRPPARPLARREPGAMGRRAAAAFQ